MSDPIDEIVKGLAGDETVTVTAVGEGLRILIRRAVAAGRELGRANLEAIFEEADGEAWREGHTEGFDMGAAAERAAIVAWLLRAYDSSTPTVRSKECHAVAKTLARCVELGEHLKGAK